MTVMLVGVTDALRGIITDNVAVVVIALALALWRALFGNLAR